MMGHWNHLKTVHTVLKSHPNQHTDEEIKLITDTSIKKVIVHPNGNGTGIAVQKEEALHSR